MFVGRVTSARGLNGVILKLVLEGESRSQVQSTQEEETGIPAKIWEAQEVINKITDIWDRRHNREI